MKNKGPSIDGFVPRRSGNQLGDFHQADTRGTVLREPENKLLHTTGENSVRTVGERKTGMEVGRSDIDDSLRDIDNQPESAKKQSHRQRRRLRKMARKPKNKFRKILKWVFIFIVVSIVAVGGYAAYKFIIAGNNIFQGNILGIFQNEPLKEDKNGRSNFLILGTSEDDPGHDGANLTDSMLVVSIDQKNKDIYMFSIPRDLYVEYGVGCSSGYSGKINAYFTCSNDGDTTEAEQDRLTQTQKLVGDIVGLDIQYGIHVNHAVIKEAVDAVGGVDVDIEGSDGSPGVLDRNFDWRCNFNCYLVKYENGTHHLDGEHALYLSMARGDVAPTYGLASSNFDREKNQQKILIALKDKAMSTGILTNISAVTQLIDSFGKNLRTNIQSNEIRTLMQVTSEVKPVDVHTISLVDNDNPVVKTGNYDGASVVMPAAGIYDYTNIQNYILKKITNDPVANEAAPIVVLNGSGQSGFGQTKSDELTKKGYNVTLVDNAPDGIYEKVEIYQIGKGNTATSKKLASTFKVKIKKNPPPLTVDADVRFVIIFGATTD